MGTNQTPEQNYLSKDQFQQIKNKGLISKYLPSINRPRGNYYNSDSDITFWGFEKTSGKYYLFTWNDPLGQFNSEVEKLQEEIKTELGILLIYDIY